MLSLFSIPLPASPFTEAVRGVGGKKSKVVLRTASDTGKAIINTSNSNPALTYASCESDVCGRRRGAHRNRDRNVLANVES